MSQGYNTAARSGKQPAETIPKKNNAYVFCGLVSGVMTKTICAPFDRIRLLYQVQPMFMQANAAAQQAPKAFKYHGVFSTARKIITEEGITGLWRGNMMNTVRGGICYATKFGINDEAKERLGTFVALQKWLDKRVERSNDPPRTNAQNHIVVSMLSGASAGILQKSFSYPLDVISVRMALGINTKVLSTNCTYNGIADCFTKILKTEGIRGFFKGFFPTLCTGVPYVAFQMTFFDFYKKRFIDAMDYDKDMLNIKQVAFISSLAGSSAGFTALSIVFPGDTVRKRMMNNAISSEKQLYRNARDCVRHIIRNEDILQYVLGIAAFYYGMFPSLLKSIPSGALQFLMYEMLKHIISKS